MRLITHPHQKVVLLVLLLLGLMPASRVFAGYPVASRHPLADPAPPVHPGRLI